MILCHLPVLFLSLALSLLFSIINKFNVIQAFKNAKLSLYMFCNNECVYIGKRLIQFHSYFYFSFIYFVGLFVCLFVYERVVWLFSCPFFPSRFSLGSIKKRLYYTNKLYFSLMYVFWFWFEKHTLTQMQNSQCAGLSFHLLYWALDKLSNISETKQKKYINEWNGKQWNEFEKKLSSDASRFAMRLNALVCYTYVCMYVFVRVLMCVCVCWREFVNVLCRFEYIFVGFCHFLQLTHSIQIHIRL